MLRVKRVQTIRNMKQNTNYNIGILVGRFQVAKLHRGHLDLIRSVCEKHQRVAIFLGVTKAMSTKKNPLDFTTRKLMIQEQFPEINVLAVPDMASDKEWGRELDNRIKEVFPVGNPLLYGGRDSFIQYYLGQFPTKELIGNEHFSGTEQRQRISNEVKASADFRAGVIFGLANQYDKVNPTVDIAIFCGDELLLARKPNEKKWRFVGGFVDPALDNSFEDAAIREAEEETGVVVDKVQYVGTYKVDDWRFRNESDKIITTLFKGEIKKKEGRPNDDIEEVKWMKFNKINNDDLVEEHRGLMDMLRSNND